MLLAPSLAHKPIRCANGLRRKQKDRSHFYSRVTYDGADGSGAWAAAKAGAAYLLEGVVDASTLARGSGVEGLLDRAGLGWLTKGTCNAGDVRAGLSQRRLPRHHGGLITVVGAQEPSSSSSSSSSYSSYSTTTTTTRLVPHLFSNGARRLFVRNGRLSPQQLAAEEGAEGASAAMWWRAGAAVAAMLAFFAGGPPTSPLLGFSWRTHRRQASSSSSSSSGGARGGGGSGAALAAMFLRIAAEALALTAAVLGASWLHFYDAAAAAKPLGVALCVAAYALVANAGSGAPLGGGAAFQQGASSSSKKEKEI